MQQNISNKTLSRIYAYGRGKASAQEEFIESWKQ
jgi:hypothetical protein